MKLKPVLTFLLILPFQAPAQDRLAELYRQATALEEAGRDPEAATRAYQAVLDEYAKERKTAATALFRLAETYRKQGKKDLAVSAYTRVTLEFPPETKLVARSREFLKGTSGAAQPPAANLAEAKKTYREALMKEIQFAELDAKGMTKQYQLGAGTQQDVVAAQDRLNESKLRLEAFDLKQLQSNAKGGRK
jgi:tetratricopeptide (TPR) repeat protein